MRPKTLGALTIAIGAVTAALSAGVLVVEINRLEPWAFGLLFVSAILGIAIGLVGIFVVATSKPRPYRVRRF
jgi:hypothetical protein